MKNKEAFGSWYADAFPGESGSGRTYARMAWSAASDLQSASLDALRAKIGRNKELMREAAANFRTYQEDSMSSVKCYHCDVSVGRETLHKPDCLVSRLFAEIAMIDDASAE